MMLVCRDHSYPIQNKFKALGYTFIRPLFWTRKALLKQISPHVDHTYKYNHKDDDESPWFCLLCKYPCSTYHHLMAHLKGPDHAATEIAWKRHIAMRPPKVREPRKPKAVVWWDIDSCPVPHNFDPSCVRLSIQSALYDSFGSLPYTIYAMGNLKRIPARTIKSLSSSGIFITHTIMGLRHFYTTFLLWSIRNPPPVVVILISDDMVWSFKDLTGLEASGYTVIRAYPGSANSCEKWLWGNLIKETPVETNSRIVEDKCDATDEPLYYCRQCKFPTCNYRSFANHLRDAEHIHQEHVVEYSRRTDAAYRLKNIQESERSNLQDQLKDTCTNQSFANHLNRNEEHFVEPIEASQRMEKKQETKPTYLQALLKNTCNYQS